MIAKILVGLINFFVAVAEIFLGLRVVLQLFGANSNVPFVQFIYESSGVLLEPFRNIFPTRELVENSFVDFSALFAMLVYGLIGMALLALVVRLTPTDSTRKK